MSDARGKVFVDFLGLGEWAPPFFVLSSATPSPPLRLAWAMCGAAIGKTYRPDRIDRLSLDRLILSAGLTQ